MLEDYLYNEDIIFSNISLRYKNNKTILNKVNLKIKAKTTVAIVGESGSGNILIKFINTFNQTHFW